MFFLTTAAYMALRTQIRSSGSSLAGGMLGGEKQGSITQALPVALMPSHFTDEWQLDPREATSVMVQLAQAGQNLQGIYLIHNGSPSAPAPTTIKRWRYNVPCFFVSSTNSSVLKIDAFAIDPLLQKASPIPVWTEQPPDEILEAHELVPGAALGCDIRTGKEVSLSYEARRLSAYMIGASGMGKTSSILKILEEDIKRGDGVCILEPHGDLIEDILLRIPSHREQDVVLWDVPDVTTPFGLNFFACHDVTNPNAVDRVCSQNINMFYKLYHASWGPQMENLLRVSFLTMIYNQDLPPTYRPTLIDVPRLWTDAAYRAYLAKRVPHKPVPTFWERVYNPLRPGAQLEFRLSSSNKIERFLENRVLYNIFGQPENSLNFRRIMDEGRILLIKLTKGELGEDNAGLLGSVIVGQIAEAATSRVDTPFQARRQFHLVVDEYQNFATKTFDTLQTEARKFAVDTLVAHQSRAFLDEESKGASGAVGTVISFAVTGEDAKEMAVMFDNTPPEPSVIGMKPILTVCTDPWDHLIRNGHSSFQVNALVLALKPALTSIPKADLPNYSLTNGNPDTLYMWESLETAVKKRFASMSCDNVRKFVTEEDLRRFLGHLNSYLYRRMKGHTSAEMAAELHALQAMGPFYQTLQHFEGSSYVQIPVGTAHDEIIAFDDAKSRKLEVDQPQRQQEFYRNLEQLAQLLVQDPILANSGQYQEIRDKPRPFADVTNETANMLSLMKPYHALCKLIDAQGNRVQHLIKTYPPSPVSADGIARAETIRQASRQQYGRLRHEVEEDIQARGAAWDELLKRSVAKNQTTKPVNVPQNDALKHLQPESARMMEDHVTTTISTNKSLPNRNGAADKQPVIATEEPAQTRSGWEPLSDGEEK